MKFDREVEYKGYRLRVIYNKVNFVYNEVTEYSIRMEDGRTLCCRYSQTNGGGGGYLIDSKDTSLERDDEQKIIDKVIMEYTEDSKGD